VLQRGPKLTPAIISTDVQSQVYDALLRNRRLAVIYIPREEQEQKKYEINPLGLVLKDGVSYLVCSMWDFPDIRLLTLHRMLQVQVLDQPSNVPAGFNLDDYITSGELDFVVGSDIKLKALFSVGAAFHLAERPLSDDQSIKKQPDGRMLVTATSQDTSELRWWLLGFGDQVEVISPKSLRKEFEAIASRLKTNYSRPL